MEITTLGSAPNFYFYFYFPMENGKPVSISGVHSQDPTGAPDAHTWPFFMYFSLFLFFLGWFQGKVAIGLLF